MRDILDEVQENLARREGKPLNPSGDIFDEMDRNNAGAMRERMRSVKSKSPEQAAKNYKVSDETGLPVDYIERNPDAGVPEFNYDSLKKRAPLLAEMLQDKRNAEIAQNELDNLSWFEETAREFKNIGKIPVAGHYQLGASALSIASSVQSALELVPKAPVALTAKTQELLGYGEAAERSWAYYDRLSSSSQSLMDMSNRQAQLRSEWMPQPSETRMSPAVLGGIESAIINIPAMAASLLTKNPNTGLALMGGVSYGSSYSEGKARGLTDFEAFTYGASNAIAEVVPEMFPLGKLLADIDGNTGFTKMLAKQMLAEGWTEQITTVWQDANAWASLNPKKTLPEFLAERPDAAYQTLISTMVATGLQTSAIAGLNSIGRGKEADVVDLIVEKANESQYRELDKTNFETFLQEVSEEYGSVDHLYIDAQAAREAMAEMEDDAAYQLLAAQIEGAVAVNGDIVIPIGEFASTVATSPNYQFLKGSIRVSPDSDTTVINAIERIQEAYESIEKKDESKRIYNEVSEQLIDAGTLTREQAKLSAEIIPAFLGANPERMGVTVEEAYEMMGLKIIGPTEEVVSPEQESMATFTSVVDSLKQGEDTPQTQELSALLESQGIDINQDSQQIINSLSTIKEFKQKATSDEVVKSDPLIESQEWREKTVTATLDDGSKHELKAGEAYDIINKRKEDAQSILDCLNANT